MQMLETASGRAPGRPEQARIPSGDRQRDAAVEGLT